MRLCRFNDGRIGYVIGDAVHDITTIVAPIMCAQATRGDALVAAIEEIARLDATLLRAAPHHPLSSVKLRCPVTSPTKVIAAPVNYRAHVSEANTDPGIRYGHTQTDIGEAGLFLKANSALAGPSDGIPIRFAERRTDYEAELVVIVGGGGSDIPIARALDHVAGYAVGLDITLRGPEDRSFRKSLDGYAVVGPWLVTADEAPDPNRMRLTLDINGESRQNASTGDMVYGVARLIEFASAFYTLYPGDLIFTGTPAGVGPIRPGDTLVAAIDGIGRLETTARAHIHQAA